MRAPWPSSATYFVLRRAMASDPDWRDQIRWAQTVGRPLDSVEMAEELIFVICNSSMHHRAGRIIYERVRAAILKGQPIYPNALAHPGKTTAIWKIWGDQERLFAELQALADDAALVEWCGRLPMIGKVTKYHAAKNLGADVVKPDRWLERIGACAGETPHAVCARLAAASGDRIGTVDLVLWWACAQGVLKP